MKRYYKRPEGNLIGGIGNFINTFPKKDITINVNKIYNIDYYKIKKKFKYDYNKLDFTQRVICPENNTEIEEFPRSKKCKSQEKNSLNNIKGFFPSLMLKTPISFVNEKGKKRINRSFDSGSKNNNQFDYDNNRFLGIARKHRIQNINLESKIAPLKFQRKHFYDKDIKTYLY